MFVIALIFHMFTQFSASLDCDHPISCATICVNSLQSTYFSQKDGEWNEGFWNNANSLEALANFIQSSKDNQFKDIIGIVLNNWPAQKILSRTIFFDDYQWWGLAYVRIYEIFGLRHALVEAEKIYEYVKDYAWDNVCNGGVWWTKEKTYKNAITNELFFSLSSKLFMNTHRKKYLHSATEVWNWFNQSGMLNKESLINDGLKDCKNNGEKTFTYNQGVLLEGLVNLYVVSQDAKYILLADNIISAVIKFLTVNGVLNEPLKGKLNGDTQQFKGIFMRYLKYYVTKTGETKWNTFIRNQFISIKKLNYNTTNGLFGELWQGPLDGYSGVSQTSVLDALTAAI